MFDVPCRHIFDKIKRSLLKILALLRFTLVTISRVANTCEPSESRPHEEFSASSIHKNTNGCGLRYLARRWLQPDQRLEFGGQPGLSHLRAGKLVLVLSARWKLLVLPLTPPPVRWSNCALKESASMLSCRSRIRGKSRAEIRTSHGDPYLLTCEQ